jgi:hypothetical protein
MALITGFVFCVNCFNQALNRMRHGFELRSVLQILKQLSTAI